MWKEAQMPFCQVNFQGSSSAMEPVGILEIFKRSVDYKLRYSRLIADSDSKTHAMLLEEQPYGSIPVEK